MLTTGMLAGISIATGVVGTGLKVMGDMKIAAASKKAEDARQRQMNLESDRQRRQVIREASMARATAQANATEQGASQTSGLQGGLAQVTGEQNRNVQAVNQSEELGNKIFSANRQMASAQSLGAFGNSIQNFGDKLSRNLDPLTRVGNYAFG